MNTAKIYTHTVTKAPSIFERGVFASLYPRTADTEDYESTDDGGVLYALPAGYEQKGYIGNTSYIFGPDNDAHTIRLDEGITEPNRVWLNTKDGPVEIYPVDAITLKETRSSTCISIT